MKTTDGGLHWQTISPDLTGAAVNRGAENSATPPTVQNAKERGFGVVYSIAPSPKKAEVIWAGSDTGLIHLTTDGGKTWNDVTPKGLGDWSKIAMIEASHFDPAVAYAAVDRHRLDDRAPYLYRTRDYGKTWQPITTGIGASFVSECNPRRHYAAQGLLFAGTELGVYVSFDDGDHWQPLQLNLPVTSVRDLVIHGDDLVIATHGRAFWILDNITPAAANRWTGGNDEAAFICARDGSASGQRHLPGKSVSAGRADGEESSRRCRDRLLSASQGRGGEARDHRFSRKAGAAVFERREEGGEDASVADCGSVVPQARHVGERRGHASFRVGPAMEQLRDRGRI